VHESCGEHNPRSHASLTILTGVLVGRLLASRNLTLVAMAPLRSPGEAPLPTHAWGLPDIARHVHDSPQWSERMSMTWRAA
jgi:hypothetical protein